MRGLLRTSRGPVVPGNEYSQQQMIIQPTTPWKGVVELVKLFSGRVDPVLKHFTHGCIIAERRTDGKHFLPAGSAAFIEGRGLSPLIGL